MLLFVTLSYACRLPHTRAHAGTHMHAYPHMNTRTHARTRTQTRTQTRTTTHTQTHTQTRTLTPSLTHTRTHAHARTRVRYVGYLLFGHTYAAFSSLGRSCFTCFQMVMGSFDADAVRQPHPLAATLPPLGPRFLCR